MALKGCVWRPAWEAQVFRYQMNWVLHKQVDLASHIDGGGLSGTGRGPWVNNAQVFPKEAGLMGLRRILSANRGTCDW